MIKALLVRAVCEESAQDLIEYALLSAFISIVGILAWQNIGTVLGVKYGAWDSGVQGLWDPPPAGGS